MNSVAFFNNKGGVGKTTLVYHLAWMASRLGLNVLAVDLDPQANLTAAFLDADRVEKLWGEERLTIMGALDPLLSGEGALGTVHIEQIAANLNLVPGDLMLAAAEQDFSSQWPLCMDGNSRAFRVIGSVAQALKEASERVAADVVLIDVGPSLGAINRVAMVASDSVVVPLSPDLYSIQGLRNLGPTLGRWRMEWADRRPRNPRPDVWLPVGAMRPAGYVVLQHSVRVDRAVGAYDRWIKKVPAEFRRSVLNEDVATDGLEAKDDSLCLGMVKHFHSLIPMAQEARKPLFLLRSADGAIGAHQQAVTAAYKFFEELTRSVLGSVGVPAG